MLEFQKNAAILFHQLVQLDRSQFFGSEDRNRWLPLFQQTDAMCMCPPFMGKNYKPGGLVIMAINPGGGNEKNDRRNLGDTLLYPKVHEFKNISQDMHIYYWDQVNPNFIKATQTYPIYKNISDVLASSQTSLDDICYFNFLPYRGRDNKYPSVDRDLSTIIPKCKNKFIEPLLAYLKPSLVVAFGIQVEKYIKSSWQDFPFETVTINRARAGTEAVRESKEKAKARLESWAEDRPPVN